MFNSSFIQYQNIIWVAGNKSSVVLNGLHLPKYRQGRVHGNKDLVVLNYPTVFVLGDVTAAIVIHVDPLILIAPVEIQKVLYLATLLNNLI